MSAKQRLLDIMNTLDFGIHDIKYENCSEWVAKKWTDSENVTWWAVEKEGSGFTQLFKGSIKQACLKDEKS